MCNWSVYSFWYCLYSIFLKTPPVQLWNAGNFTFHRKIYPGRCKIFEMSSQTFKICFKKPNYTCCKLYICLLHNIIIIKPLKIFFFAKTDRDIMIMLFKRDFNVWKSITWRSLPAFFNPLSPLIIDIYRIKIIIHFKVK